MKVVLFCGGLGIRMGEATQLIPKPMIPIGGRPILWHIMRYYASYGHCEFILCLGYRAEAVKEYFLTYNEAMSNDFVLTNGGRDVRLLSSDTEDWTITFVDTGISSTIGSRLKSVEPFLGSDEVFLATYGDGLTDLPLDEMVAAFTAVDKSAMFLSVRPSVNMHVVQADLDGTVRRIEDITEANVFINGGYFVLRREILNLIEPGDELVEQPFRRLIEREGLLAYPYHGFWAPMDTLKDKQQLDALWEAGSAPWARRAPPVDDL
jgi:glucose-1-phosphate cytidylyltransferase